MQSMVARFTTVVTAAASVPTLAVLLPPIVSSYGLSLNAVLLMAGWSLIVVGTIGTMAWFVSRALMRPFFDLTSFLNPTTPRSLRGRSLDQQDDVPQEVRMLRAVIFSRDASRRREESDRATYVSTLIHDMKTPLIAIDRSLELVRDDADVDSRKQWIDASRDEVNRLLGLVQDVVDAERLASGSLMLRVEPVNLETMCERIVGRIGNLRAEVVTRFSTAGSMWTTGDPVLLERAIENIVANAVRHARSQVHINVATGLVRIADDGRGMLEDPEMPDAAFTDSSGASSPSNSPRNSGLGLFIAKRILAAHGGRLVVESTGLRGTAVLMYLGVPGRVGVA